MLNNFHVLGLICAALDAILISWCKGSHLVFTGPESADGKLHLVPLVSLGAWDIPHCAPLGAPVYPDVDLQLPGAVAVAAVQEVAELDAMGVILAEREQEQLSPLASEMLRRIDHHEGPWNENEQQGHIRSPEALKVLIQIQLIFLVKL